MPTVSVENYLKAIFHLQGDGDERVKTKALADSLQVTLPSATNMLKCMSDAGLVDYVAYQGAVLTERGHREASRVVRNHRLIEAFLVRTLGYRWDEVHAEAERLEHSVSDDLADRIDAFLGHPEADPHGDPIPRPGPARATRATESLLATACRALRRVERVLDQQPEVLRYLDTLGVTPGAVVEVCEVIPFDGPVMVRVGDGAPRPVSRTLAQRVLVGDVGE